MTGLPLSWDWTPAYPGKVNSLHINEHFSEIANLASLLQFSYYFLYADFFFEIPKHGWNCLFFLETERNNINIVSFYFKCACLWLGLFISLFLILFFNFLLKVLKVCHHLKPGIKFVFLLVHFRVHFMGYFFVGYRGWCEEGVLFPSDGGSLNCIFKLHNSIWGGRKSSALETRKHYILEKFLELLIMAEDIQLDFVWAEIREPATAKWA